MSYLERINSPDDLRKLSIDDLKILGQEIRERIIEVTSKNGGHLAPNLGVVELTLALHYVFNTPEDKIIWDVSHQVYTHKLITGRRDRFHTLRKLGGISGFAKREESIYDVFDAGHASTSISAALGLTVARDLKKEKHKIIAVIGDGSIIAGMALEAMNHGGILKKDMIIILNDNKMSIAENKGAIPRHLATLVTGKFYNRLRADVWNLLGALPENLSAAARNFAKKIEEGLKNLTVPGSIFEEMGYRYIGPVDGHDLHNLIFILKRIKEMEGPLLLHVYTQKGKGYPPAEKNPERFHGTGPFDIKTGEPLKKKGAPPSYSKVFGETLVKLGEEDERIVAITAAMCLGTGLVPFREKFPERFFDVGICEQHAVTFAAGLALGGLKPFVAIYSTFFQRSYDQFIHDVALQKHNVVFAIDRAGLVGQDGPTHHGQFDIAYMLPIPNVVMMAPRDEGELRDMIYTALHYNDGPISFRYPRGSGEGVKLNKKFHKLKIGKSEVLREGRDGVVIAVGSMVWRAYRAAERIKKKKDYTVINARFIKPLDTELIETMAKKYGKIITVEEGVKTGGFGMFVQEYLLEKNIDADVKIIALENKFYDQGTRDELLRIAGLDEESLSKKFLLL